MHENLAHEPADSDALVSFRYTHPLARPEYLPFPLPREEPLVVEAATVLRFGLMEGTGVVNAETCVYDPQGDPADFRENGSSASRLAIVLNLSELLALGRATDEAAAVEREVEAREVDQAPLAVVHRGRDADVLEVER